jgi:hypothetical protein
MEGEDRLLERGFRALGHPHKNNMVSKLNTCPSLPLHKSSPQHLILDPQSRRARNEDRGRSSDHLTVARRQKQRADSKLGAESISLQGQESVWRWSVIFSFLLDSLQQLDCQERGTDERAGGVPQRSGSRSEEVVVKSLQQRVFSQGPDEGTLLSVFGEVLGENGRHAELVKGGAVEELAEVSSPAHKRRKRSIEHKSRQSLGAVEKHLKRIVRRSLAVPSSTVELGPEVRMILPLSHPRPQKTIFVQILFLEGKF